MTGRSTPENDLSNALSRQAEQFARHGGHSLDLDQVVSRAGEIRRGRRMRATMVMAAVVLAVAVPVGVTVIGNDPTQPEQVLPADQPDSSPIALDDLDVGALPRWGIVADGRFQLPGRTVPIGGATPRAVAAADNGLMVTSTDDSGNQSVRYVDLERGTASTSWSIDGDVAVSGDGSLVAFTQPDGTVTVLQERGTQDFNLGRIPTGTGFDTVSVNGDDCSGATQTAACGVVVVSRGEQPQTWLIGPSAGPEAIYPQFVSYVGVSARTGLTGGMVSTTDDGSCSEVLDHDDNALWQTCDHRFLEFSPDGKYLLASSAYGDGFGDTSLTVLDGVTGEVALDLTTADGAAITSMQWEDNGHVLAVVSDQQRWSVQRISLNGSREYAVAPEAGSDDLTAPFILATR